MIELYAIIHQTVTLSEVLNTFKLEIQQKTLKLARFVFSVSVQITE